MPTRKKEWSGIQLDHLPKVASEVIDAVQPFLKWQLIGPMGVGKTAFVKAVGEVLGISRMTSPTFSIVNEYNIPEDAVAYGGRDLLHMDLYRLESETELLEIGWEEYLARPDLMIVEWPELADPLWPAPYARIYMENDPHSGERKLILILQEIES